MPCSPLRGWKEQPRCLAASSNPLPFPSSDHEGTQASASSFSQRQVSLGCQGLSLSSLAQWLCGSRAGQVLPISFPLCAVSCFYASGSYLHSTDTLYILCFMWGCCIGHPMLLSSGLISEKRDSFHMFFLWHKLKRKPLWLSKPPASYP